MAGNNQNAKSESFGNRNLWQYITGTGVLRPKPLIIRELKNNKEKFLNGILFYRKPVVPAGDLLKKKNLSSHQKEFVLKLSKFLGLEEDLAYDLFFSYISQDFHGSQNNLRTSLVNERHSHSLILKIRDYYYTERLYLLQCIRHVLQYWPEQENHPYKEEYTDFLNILLENNKLSKKLVAKINLACETPLPTWETHGKLMEEYTDFLNILLENNELSKKLVAQFNLACETPLPTWETHGKLMNERQATIWAIQNLKEQHEILEILLIFWKDFDVSVDDFISMLEKLKRQGFGRNQLYKHILDESTDRLLKRICALEVLVILQALDMDGVINNVREHSLLGRFKDVDKTIKLLGSEQPHGPILLSWVVIRQIYLAGQDSEVGGMEAAVTRKLGNLALQLNVFTFISHMLEMEPFCGESMTASVSHIVVYTLLLAAFTAFDETTLARNHAEMQVLNDITTKVIKRPSIAENVWQKGLDKGIGNLFQEAMLNFPLDFSTLVRLSTSLASATGDSASKVLELWSELPRYTEYLDRNRAQDIKPTMDSTVWQLARDKLPYTAGDFRISVGVQGQLISVSKKPEYEIPIIQWEVAYDGWQLLKCEIQELLSQISGGAGNVSPVQLMRVTEISEFVRAICMSQPGAADGLEDIISLLYTIIQRFSTFNPPPLELLAASVDCVKCVAKLHPKQAWHDLKQTGFLPFQTENVDNMTEVLNGQGLNPGLYGALLAGFETVQGKYPVTVAYLDLIAQLAMPLYESKMENELMPAVMYMLRETLPVFQKWRYYHTIKREIIGQKCLTIAHKILNYKITPDRKQSTRPHLHEVCIYTLLYTEAGRSLLEIIASGVDTVETLLSQQSSQSEGGGEDLVQLIQIGFSVMNRLLLLKSHGQKMSPVEVALSSQPAGYQNQHIVAVIAEYIYHRSNPLLPKLATLFLRRLAVVLPMSILACLGNQAEPIRDIYMMRLQSATEDLSLKTGILELLSVCVETQPGLIEMFLNVQTTQPTDKSKDVSVGKVSCLQTVLDLMAVQKQDSYQCPPDLLCACTEFIQALWTGLRETAMSALRPKASFWVSLCQPLMIDLGDSSEDHMLTYKLKTISHIFKILAQEVYTVTGAKLDTILKKILKDVGEKGRFKYWSTYITGCLKGLGNGAQDSLQESGVGVLDQPVYKLLVAWKNFCIVTAKMSVPELKLDDGLREFIIFDLLDALHAMYTIELTELTHKLSKICSALFFTLVKNWTSSIKTWQQLLTRTLETVTLTSTCGDITIPSVQIGLLGAMVTVLQYLRNESSKKLEIHKLGHMLSSVCEILLQSTRELPTPKELGQRPEKADGSFVGSDIKLKLQTICCVLMDELIIHIKDVSLWLPVLQENMIISALLSSAQQYIQHHVGLHYIQPLFLVFLTIAQSDKGSESLALAGITGYLCLPVTRCYQNGDTSYSTTASQTQTKKLNGTPVTWHNVYCQFIELYTLMLERLKYSFLEDAFNFVGCHQDRLQQCLEVARQSFVPEVFREVEMTCQFVSQLSHYNREWRLNLPDSMNNILVNMVYMCQTFVSYLIRPRYLQHILETNSADRGRQKRRHESLLLHQTSVEDVDNPSDQLIQVQLGMLKGLKHSVAALRLFSPDLVQILLDQNMDIGEYSAFLALGFSTPPVDQDTPPTFGMLLSCVTVCVRLLSKIEPRSFSPQRGADQSPSPSTENTLAQAVPKPLLMFVMENALYLTMSQGMLYLKDPSVQSRDKQLLKRELATELNSILTSINRYFKRGGPQSPANMTQQSPRTQQSPGGATLSRSISQVFSTNQEQVVFRLVQEFSKQVLR